MLTFCLLIRADGAALLEQFHTKYEYGTWLFFFLSSWKPTAAQRVLSHPSSSDGAVETQSAPADHSALAEPSRALSVHAEELLCLKSIHRFPADWEDMVNLVFLHIWIYIFIEHVFLILASCNLWLCGLLNVFWVTFFFYFLMQLECTRVGKCWDSVELIVLTLEGKMPFADWHLLPWEACLKKCLVVLRFIQQLVTVVGFVGDWTTMPCCRYHDSLARFY